MWQGPPDHAVFTHHTDSPWSPQPGYWSETFKLTLDQEHRLVLIFGRAVPCATRPNTFLVLASGVEPLGIQCRTLIPIR
jgi:hypothetical protein